jgi:hypothetical protein
LYRGPTVPRPKTITPSALQEPPVAGEASHRILGAPPSRSIVFSTPSAKNPSERESGDQKGRAPFSVPDNARAVRLSRALTQSSVFPDESVAAKATWCPSGERTGACPGANFELSGGEMENS